MKVGGKEIVLFDSIKSMNIRRYQKFNLLQMQGTEVGSTFEDYRQRTAKTIRLVKSGMKDEAITELSNRDIAVFNAYNSFSPRSLAMALLVKSIDGVEKKSLLDEDLNEVVKELDSIGFSWEDLEETIEHVKKK